MIQSTSEWVDIDRVIPHPGNPNKMGDEEFAKLEANVEEDLPPLIVRSLEASVAFTEEHAAGKLQVLDGEHRWKLMKKREATEIEVRVWTNVSDARAQQLLLTLNRLHGKDDKAKRGRLIQDLYEIEPDYEVLAAVLPEDAETIEKILGEMNRESVTDATERAKTISQREPFTIFAMPAQVEKIKRAMKLATNNMDAAHQQTECEEGEALALVASVYLDSMSVSND